LSRVEGEQLHFENPPVRVVVLSRFFEPKAGVQLARLGALISEFKDRYPNIDELPPSPPPVTDGDEDSLGFWNEDQWPMPLVTFSDDLGERGVAFQHDRVQVRWAFDEGGNAYPGFRALREDLAMLSGIYERAIAELAGEEMRTTGASCFYRNEVSHQLAFREPEEILDEDLRRQTVFLRSRKVDYLGSRLEFRAGRGPEGAFVQVHVERRMDEGAFLSIFSYQPSGDLHGERALDDAHEELIEAFLGSTSPRMHEAWRRT
jgi:hypothetical protein